MTTWKIAAVQMDVRFGEVSANRDVIRARLREAANVGASLIVFPECAVTGYCFRSKGEAARFAEQLPGPTTDAIAADCRELGVHAVVGLIERDGDRLFNAAALVGPGGLIAGYRKAHLPFLGLDRFVAPGDRPFAVHDIGGLRVGLNVCYDASFPEASRCLALGGADVIALPTNWATQGEKAARILTPARALENRVHFVAVNRVGDEGGYHFIGLSQIVECSGDLLAIADHDREEILYAEIDPERARQKKIVNVPGEYEVDRVHDRRPDLYGGLSGRG